MLMLLGLAVAILNVPFGYWRSGTRKFSRAWFFHVHGSIPLVIAMRLFMGIHWTLIVGATLATSYFLGQKTGASLRG